LEIRQLLGPSRRLLDEKPAQHIGEFAFKQNMNHSHYVPTPDKQPGLKLTIDAFPGRADPFRTVDGTNALRIGSMEILP
jgi:hypothetical protein